MESTSHITRFSWHCSGGNGTKGSGKRYRGSQFMNSDRMVSASSASFAAAGERQKEGAERENMVREHTSQLRKAGLRTWAEEGKHWDRETFEGEIISVDQSGWQMSLSLFYHKTRLGGLCPQRTTKPLYRAFHLTSLTHHRQADSVALGWLVVLATRCQLVSPEGPV